MESATLDDFLALNDQLIALMRAGVPLDAGLGKTDEETAEILGRINATVARRVSRGDSLASALGDAEQFVPGPYCSLMQLGLRSGDLSTALDESNQLAAFVDDSQYSVQAAFFYPLLVCCLAYGGIVLFCLLLVPKLTSFYTSLQAPAGSALQVLQMLRNTMPYWIAIPPVALVTYAVWRFYAGSRHDWSGGWFGRLVARLPGLSRAVFYQRCANFSAGLAGLVAAGVPLEEGLRLAAGTCGDATLSEGARGLAAAVKQGLVPGDDSPTASRFPPFLRWALLHSDATVGRGPALQMAANIYRVSAQRRAERLRVVAPIVVCVIVGGGVTLAYGLALFVPVVELLKTVAS
jgi:general secretion pathway protein F